MRDARNRFPCLRALFCVAAVSSAQAEFKYSAEHIAANASALAINDHGAVVGSMDMPDGTSHILFYKWGYLSDEGSFGGKDCGAVGINNLGVFVGFGNTAGSDAYRGFMSSGGDLYPFDNYGAYSNFPLGISDDSIVVGEIAFKGPSAVTTYVHAYHYRAGVFTGLGTLGGTDSFAWAVNRSGVIVGASNRGFHDALHAFSYSDGHMTDLGTLGGDESAAFGINSAGTIVGYSTTASGAQHAFSYKNNVMTDLGTLNGAA